MLYKEFEALRNEHSDVKVLGPWTIGPGDLWLAKGVASTTAEADWVGRCCPDPFWPPYGETSQRIVRSTVRLGPPTHQPTNPPTARPRRFAAAAVPGDWWWLLSGDTRSVMGWDGEVNTVWYIRAGT